MESIVKLVQVLGPLVTVGVAVLGIRAWYWQLAAKRKFEIAEQAITVFKRATDAISHIRNPMAWSTEQEKVKIPDDVSEEKKKLIRQYGIYGLRAEATQKGFDDVRLTQILAGLHLSKKAGECFEGLFRVRHLTLVAAHMLIEDHDAYLTPEQAKEQNKRRRGYHSDLYEVRTNGKARPDDRLSLVIDEASQALEQECRAHLRPPTFWEFIWGKSRKNTSSEWSDAARDVLMLPKK